MNKVRYNPSRRAKNAAARGKAKTQLPTKNALKRASVVWVDVGLCTLSTAAKALFRAFSIARLASCAGREDDRARGDTRTGGQAPETLGRGVAKLAPLARTAGGCQAPFENDLRCTWLGLGAPTA